MLANSDNAQTIKEQILEHTEISTQDEFYNVNNLLDELAKPDLYIIGSKTGESPESMDPFVKLSLETTSSQRNVTDVAFSTPPQRKNPLRSNDDDFVKSQEQEDDLNTALALAIDGDIYTNDDSEIGEDEIDHDKNQKDDNTKMSGNSGGKPSRKTKNKRNKITRNKKTKNNQTKKHKRTKRRKVI